MILLRLRSCSLTTALRDPEPVDACLVNLLKGVAAALAILTGRLITAYRPLWPVWWSSEAYPCFFSCHVSGRVPGARGPGQRLGRGDRP